MKNCVLTRGSNSSSRPGLSGHAAAFLAAQIAAIQKIGESVPEKEEMSVEDLPESPYKNLLKKYPDLLKMSFDQESTKNNIVHRILTNDEKPCVAKVRRLLPGSPKAIKGKKTWDQLVKLGIVEKVDLAKANTWRSALHLAPKSDGSMRPTGDYRGLNLRTELDLYPLPNLRDFAQDIAGCTIFSRVDIVKVFHTILIDKRDRHKTCLATPWGLYNFKN